MEEFASLRWLCMEESDQKDQSRAEPMAALDERWIWTKVFFKTAAKQTVNIRPKQPMLERIVLHMFMLLSRRPSRRRAARDAVAFIIRVNSPSSYAR